MDMLHAIKIAKDAGYTAKEETFCDNATKVRCRGVLVNPGQLVLDSREFIRFVKDGCKHPAKYQMGPAFQSVLSKDISERLAELYEAQKPFVDPVLAGVANERSWSAEDMEGYAERSREITHLHEERIRIAKWFDSLNSQQE